MTLPKDPLAAIRAEIAAQPAAERAEFALDILAYYLDPQPAFFEGCLALGLDLTMRDLRMLFALDRRRGRPVTMDAMLAARYIDQPPDDWGTHDKAIKAAARIRAELKVKRVPATLEWQTLGYVLDAPASWRFEDAAAPDLFSLAGVGA